MATRKKKEHGNTRRFPSLEAQAKALGEFADFSVGEDLSPEKFAQEMRKKEEANRKAMKEVQ